MPASIGVVEQVRVECLPDFVVDILTILLGHWPSIIFFADSKPRVSAVRIQMRKVIFVARSRLGRRSVLFGRDMAVKLSWLRLGEFAEIHSCRLRIVIFEKHPFLENYFFFIR